MEEKLFNLKITKQDIIILQSAVEAMTLHGRDSTLVSNIYQKILATMDLMVKEEAKTAKQE